MREDVRRSPKRALLRVRADGRERVRDDRDEQVDKPKVEDDNANDVEEARHEELGVHHSVHEWRPLFNIFVSI